MLYIAIGNIGQTKNGIWFRLPGSGSLEEAQQTKSVRRAYAKKEIERKSERKKKERAACLPNLPSLSLSWPPNIAFEVAMRHCRRRRRSAYH